MLTGKKGAQMVRKQGQQNSNVAIAQGHYPDVNSFGILWVMNYQSGVDGFDEVKCIRVCTRVTWLDC